MHIRTTRDGHKELNQRPSGSDLQSRENKSTIESGGKDLNFSGRCDLQLPCGTAMSLTETVLTSRGRQKLHNQVLEIKCCELY